MRNEVKRGETWLSKAKILLLGQQKLSLDKVKSFISDEQKLVVFHRVEVLELQGAVFKAKEWIKQIRESGIEQGEASMHALSGLLGEATDIPAVDLTETTRVLTEATRKYCICRGPYEGFMIGCDMCEEWFHGHCVSITESQVRALGRDVRCCSQINLSSPALPSFQTHIFSLLRLSRLLVTG